MIKYRSGCAKHKSRKISVILLANAIALFEKKKRERKMI